MGKGMEYSICVDELAHCAKDAAGAVKPDQKGAQGAPADAHKCAKQVRNEDVVTKLSIVRFWYLCLFPWLFSAWTVSLKLAESLFWFGAFP